MTAETARRFEEMRKKIAQLDEANRLERDRLEQDRRQAEERQRAQDEFERTVRERTERQIRLHREQEALDEEARAVQEEEAQRERGEREKRRREQLRQEEERSKNREQNREQQRSRWQVFEEELEACWAEQEAEEKRRLDDYARYRQRQFEEWDRKLTAERQRFASAARSCADARRHEKMTSAAHADERYYNTQRSAERWASSTSPTRGAQQSASRPPNTGGGVGGAAASPPTPIDTRGLCPEEQAALKELQSVHGASRDVQKAKVKDLLFRWHPDKNPGNAEKATRLFQFVQRQREVVLGL